MLGKVNAVDLEKKVVRSDRIDLPFDYLILATGAYHSYFGHDEWAMNAPGLKRIIDATEIRKRILLAFELAEVGMSEAEQRRQLTFVVIGGGPTGVEMAGAIAELARYTLARDFRNIDPSSARIIIVEAGDRLLRAFPGGPVRLRQTRAGAPWRRGDAQQDGRSPRRSRARSSATC